jgi:Zn ribbon nucleic-acid-binding protein
MSQRISHGKAILGLQCALRSKQRSNDNSEHWYEDQIESLREECGTHSNQKDRLRAQNVTQQTQIKKLLETENSNKVKNNKLEEEHKTQQERIHELLETERLNKAENDRLKDENKRQQARIDELLGTDGLKRGSKAFFEGKRCRSLESS